MPPFVAEILKQVTAIWKRLDGGQRLVVGSVLFAAVIGLFGIVWWAGQPDYQVLFVAEDARQLQEAERALSEQGIAYRVDGARLLVDRSGRAAAGTALRGASLEVEPMADELSALSSITLDSASRRRLQQKFDEREVERALGMLPGVLAATVDAHTPRPSPFTRDDEDRKPRASVILRMSDSNRFRRAARAAIPQVSAGLGTPESNVTIIDAETGERFGGDSEQALLRGSSGDLLELESALAAEREEKAREVLERAFGRGFTVAVTVTLDKQWVQSVEKIETDPRNPAVRSEERTEGGSDGWRASGDPSTDDGGAARDAGSRQETSRRELEPFRGERRTGQLAPSIESVVASVSIDRSFLGDGTPGGAGVTVEDVRDMILGAIGVSREQAVEAIRVTAVDGLAERASGALPVPPPITDGLLDRGLDYAPAVGQVLVVGAILLFLRSLLRGPRPVRSQPSPAPGAVEPDISPQSARPPEDVATRRRRDIETGILEDPATMSRLLESWLAEQKS